ncbi:MAG: hypothetical protein AB8B89_10465 [Gammaproteobacteria bacterium]
MRILNTFQDLDMIEQLHPTCADCGHQGYPLHNYKETDSILDYKNRMVCFKCRSRNTSLTMVSNYYMAGLDRRRQAWFSNDLRGPIEVINMRPISFKGQVS